MCAIMVQWWALVCALRRRSFRDQATDTEVDKLIEHLFLKEVRSLELCVLQVFHAGPSADAGLSAGARQPWRDVPACASLERGRDSPGDLRCACSSRLCSLELLFGSHISVCPQWYMKKIRTSTSFKTTYFACQKVGSGSVLFSSPLALAHYIPHRLCLYLC